MVLDQPIHSMNKQKKEARMGKKRMVHIVSHQNLPLKYVYPQRCSNNFCRQQKIESYTLLFLGPVILVEASERYSYTYRDYTYRSILTLRRGLGEGTVWQAWRAPSLPLKHNSETSRVEGLVLVHY